MLDKNLMSTKSPACPKVGFLSVFALESLCSMLIQKRIAANPLIIHLFSSPDILGGQGSSDSPCILFSDGSVVFSGAGSVLALLGLWSL